MDGLKKELKLKIKEHEFKIICLKAEIKRISKRKVIPENSKRGDFNHCFNCGYGWETRLRISPKVCPKCTSSHWDNKNHEKNYKYNLSALEIGQSKTIPWNLLPNGNMDNKKNYRIARAIDSYSCRTKRKFRKEPDYTGLKIIRIS